MFGLIEHVTADDYFALKLSFCARSHRPRLKRRETQRSLNLPGLKHHMPSFSLQSLQNPGPFLSVSLMLLEKYMMQSG